MLRSEKNDVKPSKCGCNHNETFFYISPHVNIQRTSMMNIVEINKAFRLGQTPTLPNMLLCKRLSQSVSANVPAW